MRLLLLALLLVGCQQTPLPVGSSSPPPRVALRPSDSLHLERGKGSELRWQASEPVTMLVSTSPQAALGRHPIREATLNGGRWTDELAPDGVTCYYRLRRGEEVSNEVALEWPDRPLPALSEPSILVDKVNYFLEVQDGGRRVKRYPIAMGKKPDNRKVCYDNASTPEGRYSLICLQPEATY
jgi:hypothetical protein